MAISVNLTPYAKINLHLEVGRKRDDGFHDISSLMQEISISDEMVVRLSDSNECNLKVLGAELQEDNTVNKAYKAFRRVTGIKKGIDVSLLKRIPIGAGLGGASSDAASLILAMNKLLDTNLKYEQLVEIALEVGSDVPFFLKGGSAIVEGRGERIKTKRIEASYVGILVYPGFESFTREAYEMLEAKDGMVATSPLNLEASNLFETKFFNHFETPLFLRYPELKEIKDSFLNFACDFVLMTGTGSGIYALYRSWEGAKIAWDYVSKKWENCTFFIPIEK